MNLRKCEPYGDLWWGGPYSDSSNEYEYGPFLYNVTWILDNCLIENGGLVVENKIENSAILYNVAVIPGHVLTKGNLVILFAHSCTMWLLFLDIYHISILFSNTKPPFWIRQLSRIHVTLYRNGPNWYSYSLLKITVWLLCVWWVCLLYVILMFYLHSGYCCWMQ